jgi:dipeptide/tripeptide permease
MTEEKSASRFPVTFWVGNGMELFERAAYYGCFLFLTIYLTDRVGFSDVQTGWIVGTFSFLLYMMPTFMGILSDRIGFKAAICLAFALLATGYGILGAVPTKPTSLIALLIILLGGAIVKPVISGTAAKCSTEANRARALSIFYAAVNIGAFYGKFMADPVRIAFDNPNIPGSGLQYVNFYSSGMALVGLLFGLIAYKNVEKEGTKTKSVGELLRGLAKAVSNLRFLSLIVITGLFWSIQGQLYATMPKYLGRMVEGFSKPGWIANINPLVVICCVYFITKLMKNVRPVSSIAISFLIIPLSALMVSLSPQLGTERISLGFFSLHPVELMLIIGIGFQGLAECFLSPRYLEFASKQAPEGETGLYMGFSHLNTGFGWLFGFALSGKLLEKWCPDPNVLPKGITIAEKSAYYTHAHYIWYVFTGVGILGFILLMLYRYITDRIDAKKTLPQ